MGYGARIAGPASDIRPCPCAGFFTVEGTGRLDRALPYGSPCGCMVERRAENSMEAGLSTQKESRGQAREQEKGRGSSQKGLGGGGGRKRTCDAVRVERVSHTNTCTRKPSSARLRAAGPSSRTRSTDLLHSRHALQTSRRPSALLCFVFIPLSLAPCRPPRSFLAELLPRLCPQA